MLTARRKATTYVDSQSTTFRYNVCCDFVNSNSWRSAQQRLLYVASVFDAERFRARLAEMHVSQGVLARRIGVSQQTIARLASGTAYGSKHLHRIARELHTTPAFLTGETDDPLGEGPPVPTVDSETRELNDHFAEMSSADRRALLQIARSLSGGGGASDTVHTPKTKFKGKAE